MKKTKVLVAVCIVAITALVIYEITCEEKKIKVADSFVFVEIANTDSEREKGLSNRKHLKENKGMLFIFDEPDRYGFWMKDTLIPLDILWINNGEVVHIEENVRPESFPNVYRPDELATKVLEVNAGWVSKNKVLIGSKVEY